MGKLLDSDAVVAMLRQEAKEWATIAGQYPIDTFARGLRAGIASGYAAASQDVEDLVKKQNCVVDSGTNPEGKSE